MPDLQDGRISAESFPTGRGLCLRADAVLQRAKTSAVRTVMCDGAVIYQDGRFARVDRDAALRALHEDLQKALSNAAVCRKRCCRTSGHSMPAISAPSGMSRSTDPVRGRKQFTCQAG